MENLKRTLNISGYRGKVYTLTEDLLRKGYFIRRVYKGWELCLYTSGNHISWSTSLRGLDAWISHNKKKLQGEL